MKWGWRRIDSQTWRYDDRWSVAQGWADGQWYVVDGGKWRLENYPEAQGAITAAERLMEGGK